MVNPHMFIFDLIQQTNDGYRNSRVPIKLVLNAFENIKTKKLNGEGIVEECKKVQEKEEERLGSSEWDIISDVKKKSKCYKKVISIMRKSKGLFQNENKKIKRLHKSKQ